MKIKALAATVIALAATGTASAGDSWLGSGYQKSDCQYLKNQNATLCIRTVTGETFTTQDLWFEDDVCIRRTGTLIQSVTHWAQYYGRVPLASNFQAANDWLGLDEWRDYTDAECL